MSAATKRSLRQLRRAVHCRLQRLGLQCLRHIFRFDAWHAAAPYACRAYKAQVVQLVDSLKPDTVVEVGCGLGDILTRIRAARRFGIDADAKVLFAARFLHPRGAQWIHGTTADVPSVMPDGQRIDCLIMVNWIHALSPKELSELLLPLLPRVRHLILDAIDLDGPQSYRFKHDFDFLAAVARRVATVRAVDEPRSFLVFETTS